MNVNNLLSIIFNKFKGIIFYYLKKKYVYLTFDDGPLDGTLNCINLCNKHALKATFFLVGEHMENNSGRKMVEVIKKIIHK